MGSRATANIWLLIFKYKSYKYLPWKIFSSPYFWQDSFLTYWNKLIGCKLTGHYVKLNSDDKPFCFKCYREMKSRKWKALGVLIKHDK